MRILHLVHNVAYTGGGTFYRALHLGRHLVRRGHEVTLICSSANARAGFRTREVDGLQLVQAPGIFPRTLRYGYDPYETLVRIIHTRRHGFDIVHAFDCRPTVIYPALCASRRSGVLVTDWSDWFGRGGAVELRRNRLLRSVLRPIETFHEENFRRKAVATTVISSALREKALTLGLDESTLLLLPHGADTEAVRPTSKSSARSASGLPFESPIIGHLGSLFPDDLSLLIDAFQILQRRHTDIKLLLIGNPKARVPKLRGIREIGFVSYQELSNLLAACDVLCLPLCNHLVNRARWPSKVADYMSSGRPTVATDVGDAAQALVQLGAGLVSEPNPQSFANTLERLLTNVDEQEKLGAAARAAAEGEYHWSTLTARLEDLYKAIMRPNRQQASPLQ